MPGTSGRLARGPRPRARERHFGRRLGRRPAPGDPGGANPALAPRRTAVAVRGRGLAHGRPAPPRADRGPGAPARQASHRRGRSDGAGPFPPPSRSPARSASPGVGRIAAPAHRGTVGGRRRTTNPARHLALAARQNARRGAACHLGPSLAPAATRNAAPGPGPDRGHGATLATTRNPGALPAPAPGWIAAPGPAPATGGNGPPPLAAVRGAAPARDRNPTRGRPSAADRGRAPLRACPGADRDPAPATGRRRCRASRLSGRAACAHAALPGHGPAAGRVRRRGCTARASHAGRRPPASLSRRCSLPCPPSTSPPPGRGRPEITPSCVTACGARHWSALARVAASPPRWQRM